jgi:hypothetical protein
LLHGIASWGAAGHGDGKECNEEGENVLHHGVELVFILVYRLLAFDFMSSPLVGEMKNNRRN